MQYSQPNAESRLIPPRTLAPPPPLWTVGEQRQLDEAVDYAARVCRGPVSEFVAAPVPGEPAAGIEVAVEFFVPPADVARFGEELDRAMVRRSLGYSAARRGGRARAVRVTVLPPSAFHQWRAASRIDARGTAGARRVRWSEDRRVIDEVLHQTRIGWRELYSA